MPVRAPVKQASNLLEVMTSKRQVLLGRFAGKEDHAPVRVGSAAMSAPFALFNTNSKTLTQNLSALRPRGLTVRRGAQPAFSYGA